MTKSRSTQPARDRSILTHRRPAPFDAFWFGAAYYPEHWDERVRAKDAQRMADASFNVVRMAEFAWDRMEPSEGKLDFSFFEKVIAELGEKGVRTILCTPTATPPRWLTRKHPEILRVDDKGMAMQHGSRQHCCLSNPVFRQYSRAITSVMSAHFAKNAHVVGWQTDNEIYCEFSECHCESCQKGFREYLRAKYATIDKLNRAWGTAFWALTFGSFEEIETPKVGHPTSVNPSQRLDYYRFLAHVAAEFQHEQTEILRAAQPKWFIMHNSVFAHIDYRGSFTKDLDVLGVDVYPMFTRDSRERLSNQAFQLDSTRALSGNFIVPEQQSGPGGHVGYLLATPEPGEMRMMTYTSIARGADSLLYFRWRTCRFGAEEYWCGILDHDSVPRRRYREAADVGRELKAIGPAILGTSVRIDAAVAAGDMDNTDAHTTLHFELPSPDSVARTIHGTLLRQGYAVGCVHPSDDLTGIRLYFIPHWVIIDPTWLPNLKSFVEGGGTLVIGARTATRNLDNQVVGDTLPGVLRDLVGATVEEYGRQHDTANRPLALRAHRGRIPTTLWYEALKCESAEPLYKWTGRHLNGQPAVTVNRVGKGRVVYVGTYFDETVTSALLPTLAEFSGLKPLWMSAPSGVEVVVRESADKEVWFFINHNDNEAVIRKMPAGKDLITAKATEGAMTLGRYGVAVVRVR